MRYFRHSTIVALMTIPMLAGMQFGALITSTTESAFATTFTPVLDEFWILKNSTEIFRDSFNDTIPPPSGPMAHRLISLLDQEELRVKLRVS